MRREWESASAWFLFSFYHVLCPSMWYKKSCHYTAYAVPSQLIPNWIFKISASTINIWKSNSPLDKNFNELWESYKCQNECYLTRTKQCNLKSTITAMPNTESALMCISWLEDLHLSVFSFRGLVFSVIVGTVSHNNLPQRACIVWTLCWSS